ncbi:MAG: 4Fe-4S binding protein, partial [Klebsiella sp.]|nr:4Fe-4S binding protein [Klebsiella sp.]
MTRFIVASSQACIGCRTCEVACALEHVAPGAEFHPRLKVMRLDDLSVPVMCHQCENAPCVGACPTGALSMGAEKVEADGGRCIGCQSCVVACPFGAIEFSGSRPLDIPANANSPKALPAPPAPARVSTLL